VPTFTYVDRADLDNELRRLLKFDRHIVLVC